MRVGRNLAPGLEFTLPDENSLAGQEVKPWVELLQKGLFSDDTLARLPLSYQTTDVWQKIIQDSADSTSSMTWLHALHLGVASAERGNIDEPLELFKKSIELNSNPIAHRCVAVLQTDVKEAWHHFQKAWVTATSSKSPWSADPAADRVIRNLAAEICFFLQQYEWWDELRVFLTQVPDQARELDAVLTSQAKVALYSDKTEDSYQFAANLLGKHCFPTYGSARDDLMRMWHDSQNGLAAAAKGAPLTGVEAHQVRIKHKVPENIGCQYASEFCIDYW
jgi:hypothetical protein